MSNDRRIDYVEFGSTDLSRTKAFYQSVFGWRFTDYGPDYTAFEDGRLTGGFHQSTGSKPLVVIYADDLDALKATVLATGAQVINEHSFPGGRRFHFLDPSGNELAVWSDR